MITKDMQLKEFHKYFFSEAPDPVGLVQLDDPLPTTSPQEEQVKHILTHASLASCNGAFAQAYGYEDAQTLRGAPLVTLLPPTEECNTLAIKSFVAEEYRLRGAGTRGLDAHGHSRLFLSNLIGTVEGKQLVRIWGVQHDITGRRIPEAGDSSLLETLTPRQREVLECTVRGMSLKETAARLNISPKTVETLRKRLIRKIGVSDTAGLIRNAHRFGFDPDIIDTR